MFVRLLLNVVLFYFPTYLNGASGPCRRTGAAQRGEIWDWIQNQTYVCHLYYSLLGIGISVLFSGLLLGFPGRFGNSSFISAVQEEETVSILNQDLDSFLSSLGGGGGGSDKKPEEGDGGGDALSELDDLLAAAKSSKEGEAS
jgi:hypothetical protein